MGREAFERTKPIRDAVLSTIEELAPASTSDVFTDGRRLTCDLDEQVRRIDTPDRRARLKGSDPEGYRWFTQNVPLWWPPEDELLTFDTTNAPPADVAARIRAELGL